jgi:hypothetical protein
MGNRICDPSQVRLPLTPTPIYCLRCKGQGTTYRFNVPGAEVAAVSA